MFDIAKHRPHIRVNKCKCGWFYMSRLPEDRDYCPQCKDVMNAPRRCGECGRKIDSTRWKHCPECSRLVNKVLTKYQRFKPDRIISAIINASNQKRSCGVSIFIECENCPYPDCIEKED